MKKRQHFTLFELLIAVGLLVILTTVLLRMFLLTSDMWSASEEQARLYADAKTALSIISEDLENIVYQDESDAADPTNASLNNVTAPLWLEAFAPKGQVIKCYSSYNGNYTAGLHLVTHSTLGANTSYERSGIFMVSYRFVPPLQAGTEWDSPSYATTDGTLARATIDDRSGNFNSFLTRTKDTPMNSVFTPPDTAFKRIVTGVLDFQILAYPAVDADNWDNAQYPADLVTEDGYRVRYASSHAGSGQEDNTGAKAIETIQIVLTLIPPERIPELRKLLNENKTQEVKEYLFKYSRTFRKTIRIRNRVSDKEE